MGSIDRVSSRSASEQHRRCKSEMWRSALPSFKHHLLRSAREAIGILLHQKIRKRALLGLLPLARRDQIGSRQLMRFTAIFWQGLLKRYLKQPIISFPFSTILVGAPCTCQNFNEVRKLAAVGAHTEASRLFAGSGSPFSFPNLQILGSVDSVRQSKI